MTRSSLPVRLALGACLTCLGVWLAWLVVSTQMTPPGPSDMPGEDSTRWPRSAATLTREADSLIDAGDFDGAITRAQQALLQDPLSYSALGVLSLALEVKGEQEQADRLLEMAATRSLRDIELQGRYIDLLLRRGQQQEAILTLDGMLRSRGTINAGLVTALLMLAGDPVNRPALVKVLSERPNWRMAFFRQAAPEPLDLLTPLLVELARTDAPVTNDELRPLLNAQIKAGNIRQARDLWQQFGPGHLEMTDGNLLFNGAFEQEASGTPFDWKFETVRNVEARLTRNPDGGEDRALSLYFGGGRFGTRYVTQTLTLDPGDYVLAGREKTDQLETPRGLVWRISCLGQPPRALATTEFLRGTAGWRDFSVPFAVPDQDCDGQILRLELDVRAQLDGMVTGRAWFDQMSIRKAPASTSQ